MVFNMEQGFYTFLDDTSCQKFLDKRSEDINIGTMQGTSDKIPFDPETGQ